MPTVRMSEFELEIIAEPGEQSYDQAYGFIDGGYGWTSSILLRIHQSGEVIKTAFVAGTGGATGVHESSFVVKNERIAICCCDSIFCLSIPSLELLWQTKADTGTCFEIFPYKDDYIVHGELEISRLDSNGKILWQHGGREIFTRLNSTENDFVINDNYILATDWNDRKYKFDFDGSLIR